MKSFSRLPVLLGSFVVVNVAGAAQWDVSNSLGLGLTYSDNLTLQPQGDAGIILNVTPSIGLEGTGGRATANFSYRPSLLYYPSGIQNGDDLRLAHVLDANMNTELYRNELFLDASATAGFNNISTQGIISNSLLNQTDNQVQTYTLKLSPYSTLRLNRNVALDARYSLGTVFYEGSAADDSTTHDVSLTVRKVNQSTPFTWSTNADYSTADTGSRDSSRYSLTGTLGWRFDATWAVSGTAGYEDADVETSRSDTNGLTWSVGPRWTPNPRTDMSLQYGHSYFGSTWDVNFSHRSRRSELQVTYSRGLANARDFAAAPVPIGIGPIGGGVNPTAPSLSGEDFVSDALSGELSLNGRRTTVSASLDYSLRTYEVSGSKEWLVGAGINGQRTLSSALSLNGGLYWQYIDPPGLGDAEIQTATLGISRTVGRDSSLSLSFQHRQQSGDTTTEYTENRISASLQTGFL